MKVKENQEGGRSSAGWSQSKAFLPGEVTFVPSLCSGDSSWTRAFY